jgi:F0F1-type ATP synthase delta subunit
MTQKKKNLYSSKRKDNMKLLFSMKEVLDYISQARDFLEIPSVMYSSESSSEEKNSESEMWYQKKIEESDELEESEIYKNKLRKIKGLLINKEIDVDEANRRAKEIDSVFPFNYLTNSVKNIIEKYNIPENYTNIIRHYILFGTIQSVPYLPFAIKYERDIKKRKTVEISVYEKLTDKDLEELKKHVNEYFGSYLPEFRPIKNIDAKIKAKEYIDNKFSFDYAEQVEHKMDAKEIADNVKADTGIKLRNDEIYDIPRQLNRLLGKNFKKKSGN